MDEPIRGRIVVALTEDEALVLSDWLDRLEELDRAACVDDRAVWVPFGERQ